MKKLSKQLFSDKAEAYARYRPSYPSDAIDILFNGLEKKSEIKAVDVGAGTGISSVLLANRGANVLALEPNPNMIKVGYQSDNLKYQKAPAEKIPMEDNSVDLVTSFQSFHWFNFKKSLKEFNRILTADGRLGIVWSYWDEQDPFTAEYTRLISEATKENDNSVSPYDGFSGKIKQLRIRVLWKFKFLSYFKNVERYKLKYNQKLDKEGLIGCAQSQSYIVDSGPLWDTLVKEINVLSESREDNRLRYNINIFTATPR